MIEDYKIQIRKVSSESLIIDSLKQMDENRVKLLIVYDNDLFYGLLSIGDIQRAIIKKFPLDTPIKEIMRKEITYAKTADSIGVIKGMMLQFRTECMPVLDENSNLIHVYFWEDLFPIHQQLNNRKLKLPVIIMAGGKGERMKPLTNIIPKPLIPIGEKTIVETIMDGFINVGCSNFHMSVNFKSDMIEYYFNSIEKKYSVSYFKEPKPLGTIGSVSLLKNKISSTFFVSNCDIIVDQDFYEVYDYHKNNNNEITIIAALKHYKIPYGVIDTGDNGVMTKLSEKPEITFMINTGVYIMEPHLINEIPENTFYHVTDLIDNIQKRNGKVGVFPVSERSWIDIGSWGEYLHNQNIK